MWATLRNIKRTDQLSLGLLWVPWIPEGRFWRREEPWNPGTMEPWHRAADVNALYCDQDKAPHQTQIIFKLDLKALKQNRLQDGTCKDKA